MIVELDIKIIHYYKVSPFLIVWAQLTKRDTRSVKNGLGSSNTRTFLVLCLVKVTTWTDAGSLERLVDDIVLFEVWDGQSLDVEDPVEDVPTLRYYWTRNSGLRRRTMQEHPRARSDYRDLNHLHWSPGIPSGVDAMDCIRSCVALCNRCDVPPPLQISDCMILCCWGRVFVIIVWCRTKMANGTPSEIFHGRLFFVNLELCLWARRWRPQWSKLSRPWLRRYGRRSLSTLECFQLAPTDPERVRRTLGTLLSRPLNALRCLKEVETAQFHL